MSPTPSQLASRLIIHWREPHPFDALWIVRGLDTNGDYYGELVVSSLPNSHDGAEKAGAGFTGKLTQSEADTVFQAARSIAPRAVSSPDDKRLGLLAKGPYSNPELIYEHYPETGSVALGQNFSTVISTFKPYFAAYLQDLLVAVRHPDWSCINPHGSE